MSLKKVMQGGAGCVLALSLLVSCGEKAAPDTLFRDVVKNEITGLTGSLVEGVYGRAGAISPSFPKALSIQCAMAKTTGRLCT